MRKILALLYIIISRLSFSLYKCNGSLQLAGLAISLGLYCQFENTMGLGALCYKIISVSSLRNTFNLLPVISNSVIQSLEILFLLSSLIIILHHTLKVSIKPSI